MIDEPSNFIVELTLSESGHCRTHRKQAKDNGPYRSKWENFRWWKNSNVKSMRIQMPTLEISTAKGENKNREQKTMIRSFLYGIDIDID